MILNLKFDQIKTILLQTFKAGVNSCHEMKDQILENILVNNKVFPEPNMKLLSLRELQNLPIGTVLLHPILGRGEVSKTEKFKCAVFDRVSYEFSNAGFPWNYPVLKLIL